MATDHAHDRDDDREMVLELRPAHDPEASWGFTNTVVDVEDLPATATVLTASRQTGKPPYRRGGSPDVNGPPDPRGSSA